MMMSETPQESETQEALPEAVAEAPPEAPPEALPETPPQIEDALGRVYATGKRKNAIARVWIMAGSGSISVNKKPSENYFRRFVLNEIIRQPFKIAECERQFDVVCSIKGGGLSGQAGALRHGIARALAKRALAKGDEQMRGRLKAEGLLTRDARVVERKKYGRRKARRRFQFSKR